MYLYSLTMTVSSFLQVRMSVSPLLSSFLESGRLRMATKILGSSIQIVYKAGVFQSITIDLNPTNNKNAVPNLHKGVFSLHNQRGTQGHLQGLLGHRRCPHDQRLRLHCTCPLTQDFRAHDEAERAVQDRDGSDLNGKKLRVEIAGKPKGSRGPQPGDECRFCGKAGHWYKQLL